MQKTKPEILIAGGTGLIGTQLIKSLTDKYDFVVLTRDPDKHIPCQGISYVKWQERELATLLEGKYAVVNLVGENIGAKRWTKKQKNKILETRVKSAKAIATATVQCKTPPQVLLQASAVGYYPNHEQGEEGKLYTASDFLSEVCLQTEKAIHIADHISRVIVIRTGIVLAQNADIWKQITMPFCFGVAPILGNGKQTIPWIHIEDEVGAIAFLLQQETSNGAYNLCAEHAVTWSALITEVQKHKKISLKFYIPAFILRIVFGSEKAKELMLKDQPISPNRLVKEGFRFKYSHIDQAINSLIDTK